MAAQGKNLVVGLLAVVALVALAGFVRRGCGGPRVSGGDTASDFAVAGRLAQEVSQDQEPGKVLLVRQPGMHPGAQTLQNAQVSGFTRGLQGGGWDVVELPPPDMDPQAQGSFVMRSYAGEWGKELLSWLGPHQDAVAVVSMVGVPNLPGQAWKQVPPFYASTSIPEEKDLKLLGAGEVEGLAIMREDADPVAVHEFRGSPEELFDLAYEYRTAP